MVAFRRSGKNLNLRQRLAGAFFFALVSLLVHPSASRADLLFEGYSTVLLEGVHVGYIVQRFEFDNKKQEFITAYYLKTNQIGGNITESLKARSSASLKPISYQFTELVGEKAKTIDAQFNGDNMTATIQSDGRKQVVQKKIPKGAFLASFLGYVMPQGKEGIKKGVKYSYQAIAEEDAVVSSGEAYIAGEEAIHGINAFKILNTFKGVQFVSYCTFKAEVIATRSPVQKISTELVANVREATAGLTLNSSALTQLFGSVPKGTENPVARRSLETPPAAAAETAAPEASPAPGQASPEKMKKLETKPTPSPDSPKKQGVPAGAGLHLKGQPEGK